MIVVAPLGKFNSSINGASHQPHQVCRNALGISPHIPSVRKWQCPHRAQFGDETRQCRFVSFMRLVLLGGVCHHFIGFCQHIAQDISVSDEISDKFEALFRRSLHSVSDPDMGKSAAGFTEHIVKGCIFDIDFPQGSTHARHRWSITVECQPRHQLERL